MSFQPCDLQIITLMPDTDTDLAIFYTDEAEVPVDCTGWGITAEVRSLGRAILTAVPIQFVDFVGGQTRLTFDVAAVRIVQENPSPVLHLNWVKASGDKELTRIALEVGC